MKKVLLGIFLLLSINTLALDAHLRLGGVTNTVTYSKEGKEFSSYVPSFGLEVTQSLMFVDLGAGITYNKGTGSNEVDTVPVYGVIKYNILPVGLKPYLVGKAGTVLYTDDKYYGGDATTYYAGGVGITFANMQAEILYSQTQMEKKDLEQVSVVFGINIF